MYRTCTNRYVVFPPTSDLKSSVGESLKRNTASDLSMSAPKLCKQDRGAESADDLCQIEGMDVRETPVRPRDTI